MTKKVKIFTKLHCAYCGWAKDLLNSQKIAFDEIQIDSDPKGLQEMQSLTDRRTVPQIFIGDRHVGGFDDLKALYDAGKLDEWLQAS